MIVFLDSDLLILKNIDELFEQKSQVSAVFDMGAPGVHNTGVMVIRPNGNFARSLVDRKFVSYNGGDQGFLHHAVPEDSWCVSHPKP